MKMELSPMLQALKSLATRVPKIILSRVDQEYSDLDPCTDPLFGIKKEVEDSDHEFSHFVVNGDHCQHVDPFVKLEDESSPIECALSVSQVNTKEKNDFQILRTEKSEKHLVNKQKRKIPPKKIFICYICYEQSNTKKKLNLHLRIHDSKDPLVCELCNEKLKDGIHLNRHYYRNHPERKPFKCDTCDKRFRAVGALNAHLMVHSVRVKNFGCPICGKTFDRAQSLKIHGVIHSDERKYACSMCKKSFKLKSSLKSHYLHKHSEERNFPCKICNCALKCLGALKTHMLLHDGARPFQCDECHKSFRQRTHLLTHINTVHLGKKSFQCDQCSKLFTQSSHLKTHIRSVHIKERKYKCPRCNHWSKSRQSLGYHISTHISDKPYKCTFCPHSFAQPTPLRSHMLLHEKGKLK